MLKSLLAFLMLSNALGSNDDPQKTTNSQSTHKMSEQKSPLKIYVGGSNKKPYDSKSGSVALFTFSRAVFDKGLAITRDYSISPGFIKSWSWDFKEEKYVLKVDTNRKFHNGRSVTAQDVEFMLLKSNLSPINLKARRWLMNIEGFESLKSGTKFTSGMVKGVRVISNDSLEIKLSKPNPAFLFNLGRGIPSLVPPELVSADLINFKDFPIGVGDFKVIEDDPKTTRVRLLNLNPKSDKSPLLVDLLNDGDPLESDIVIGPRINPLPQKYTPVYSDSAVSVSTIQFNYANDVGRNAKFRSAIHHALNRVEIAKSLPLFSPAFEYLADGMLGRIKPADPFNPELARKLVSELPSSVRNKVHTIFFYGKLEWNPQVKLIEQQLSDVGIKVKFIGVNGTKIRLEDDDKDIPMFMAGQMADYLDSLNCFSDYLPGSNDIYQHPEKDDAYLKLFEYALTATSLDQRVISLQDLSKYFLSANFAVPVVEQKQVFWVDSAKVDALEDLSNGAEINIQGIKLK